MGRANWRLSLPKPCAGRGAVADLGAPEKSSPAMAPGLGWRGGASGGRGFGGKRQSGAMGEGAEQGQGRGQNRGRGTGEEMEWGGAMGRALGRTGVGPETQSSCQG